MDEVIAVLQARMHSERLPGKVLADIAGRPLIAHIIERLQATRGIDRVVLAVPTREAYMFEHVADEYGVDLSPGSAGDVLGRYYLTAGRFPAPITIRVTGDNPLIDTHMLGRCIRECRSGFWDMVGTSGLPLGTSAEVFPTSLLDLLNRYGTAEHHREHVTSYIYENENDFRVLRLRAPRSLEGSHLRLTVDTPEDLSLIRMLYDELYQPGHILDLVEVVRFLHDNPGVAELNSHVRQRTWKREKATAVA